MTNLQQTLELWGSKYYEDNSTLHTNSNDKYGDMPLCASDSSHDWGFVMSLTLLIATKEVLLSLQYISLSQLQKYLEMGLHSTILHVHKAVIEWRYSYSSQRHPC